MNHMENEYTEITDLQAADGDNPSGLIKDGTTDGTLWNKVFANDLYQAIWKCVRDSGITPNGDFDNVSNGYQLFDAMFGYNWKEVGNDGGLTTFLNGATASTGPYTGGRTLRYCKSNGGKILHIEGWYTPPSTDFTDVFVLPSGYRPNQSCAAVVVTFGQVISYDKILSSGNYTTGETGGAASLYVNISLPLD